MDLASVPPCRKSLVQHIRRVNYQVGIWKHAHVPNPNIPLPTENIGWTLVDAKLEPPWFDGDALPKILVGIWQRSETDDDNDGDDDDDDDENFDNTDSMHEESLP